MHEGFVANKKINVLGRAWGSVRAHGDATDSDVRYAECLELSGGIVQRLQNLRGDDPFAKREIGALGSPRAPTAESTVCSHGPSNSPVMRV